MKAFSLKYMFVFALISAAMLSCDDIVTYNDGYDNGLSSNGAPKITKVSKIDSRDSEITGGNLAQMVIIQGENLSDVKSIKFNDVEVNLKDAYVKAKEIVVPVPRVIPSAINDKLVVTTVRGEASIDFKVSIPPVTVTGLYNEFVAAGDTLEIMGSNFDLYMVDKQNGKVTLGGAPVEITEATETLIKVKIPANAAPDSKVSITSPKVTTPLELLWRHSGLVMLNFNNLGDNGIWSGSEYVTDGSKTGDPKPLIAQTKFSRIAFKRDAWSWNNVFGGGLNINDADIIAHPENYLFKFEINTKSAKPLSIGNIIFRLNGGWLAWNPAVGISFNTYNEWKTVTFNLKDISNPLSNGWNSFEIIYQPTASLDCDFSFANLRIVHK